jgi:hypothetical protein
MLGIVDSLPNSNIIDFKAGREVFTVSIGHPTCTLGVATFKAFAAATLRTWSWEAPMT